MPTFDIAATTLIISNAYRTGWEVVLSQSPEKLVFASSRHEQEMSVVPTDGGKWHVKVFFSNDILSPKDTTSEVELCELFSRSASLARFRALPSNTETERTVRARIGQDTFRTSLIDYWEGGCAVTGICLNEILRASHAKPWAECESDAERLDVFNGLLLTANIDALFDQGLISFSDNGTVIISNRLQGELLNKLLPEGDKTSLRKISEGHKKYLEWHRTRVFK